MINSDELLKICMEAPVGICALAGPHHTFTLANHSYMHLLFGEARDLLGKPVREVLPDIEEGQWFFELLDKVYKTGEPQTGKEVPTRAHLADGHIKNIFINFSLQARRNIKGEVIGILVIVYDVTKHVEDIQNIIDNADFLRLITDRMPTFVSYMDTDRKYRFVNKAFTKWFDKTFDEIEGKTRAELFVDPKLYDYISPFEDRALNGESVSFELTLTKPNGDYINLDTEYKPDFDPSTGKVRGVIGVGQDVTERKRTLMQGKRVAEMLNAAKEAAENASSAKSAFLANVSHEIRTPLGAILGFSNLLKDPTLPEEQREHYIETITRNGQALTRLIDDILDLAKVEAGQLDVEEIHFSFADLLSEVMALFQEKAQEKNIRLTLEVDSNVPKNLLSDPTRLRQILINIIGNAIKFTDVGGVDIEVSAEPTENACNQFEVKVKDTGCGLTEEQLERLFKPFTQADNTTTRRFGGTGLGLALSKRLSEALGGDIKIADCTSNVGCTFVITFLAKTSVVQIRKPVPKTESAASKPLNDVRVLLVEDSTDNQLLVQYILSKNGAKVEIANNGLEAVEKATKQDHDVVLMDIQMPKMDGYQATSKLLSQGYKKPIIALTAHAMIEDRLKTQAAGFSGHLTKPLNNRELIETIAQLTRA